MEEHLPLDSPLGGVYRVGGALGGLILLIFGVAGFFTGAPFLGTEGEEILGLHTNGLLSLISVVFGVLLIGGAIIGGNVAAATNTAIGTLMLVSGLLNLTVIRTDANFLAFTISNVVFSFVLGVVILTFGLYGRVSGGDPRGEGNYPPAQGSDTG